MPLERERAPVCECVRRVWLAGPLWPTCVHCGAMAARERAGVLIARDG